MRNTKGITLIALIITIIVMLILVAVTISVALNGGIFNNATDAKTKTQKAVSKEELISTMVGAYDSTGSFDKDLVGTLPSGAKWCKEDETYANATNDPDECDWIITEMGNKFYVDSSGSVLDEKPVDNLIPTAAQKTAAIIETGGDGNFYNFIYETLMYMEVPDYNVKYVQINIGGYAYIFACDSTTATAYESAYGITGMQVNKWYYGDGESSFELYEGVCPINKSDFTSEQIKNEEYLDRVIATFPVTND